MNESAAGRLYMSANGFRHAIGPDDTAIRARYESLVAADYDRCHPDDTFEDLKRRARFSKEDQGLLRDWMRLAADRVGASERQRAGGSYRLAA